VVAGSCIILVY